jgi:type IV pilus assembly protein PilC
MFGFRSLRLHLTSSDLSTLARACATITVENKPAHESLALLSQQVSTRLLAEVLSRIADRVKKGDLLTSALLKEQALAGTVFCKAVAYSDTGNQENLYLRLAEYYDNDTRFHNKIFRLLKYPAFVLSGILGISGAMLGLLILDAVRKIKDLGSDSLPAATKTVLTAVSFASTHWQTLVLILILFIVAAWYLNVKHHWQSQVIGAMPFANNFCRKISLYRFSCAYSFLLAGKLSCSHACVTASTTVKNTLLRDTLLHALQKDALTTPSLSERIKSTDTFPPLVNEIISNTLMRQKEAALFKKIAEFYEEEIEAAVAAFVLIVEPVIVALIGIWGGGILLALYLPMLHAFGSH